MRVLPPPPDLPVTPPVGPVGPRCNACHAPMRWAISESSGKRIPLDVEPVAVGNIVETGRTHSTGLPMVRYLKKADRPTFPSLALAVAGVDDPPPRYTTHFATCPEAERFRK